MAIEPTDDLAGMTYTDPHGITRTITGACPDQWYAQDASGRTTIVYGDHIRWILNRATFVDGHGDIWTPTWTKVDDFPPLDPTSQAVR